MWRLRRLGDVDQMNVNNSWVEILKKIWHKDGRRPQRELLVNPKVTSRRPEQGIGLLEAAGVELAR